MLLRRSAAGVQGQNEAEAPETPPSSPRQLVVIFQCLGARSGCALVPLEFGAFESNSQPTCHPHQHAVKNPSSKVSAQTKFG